MPNNEITHLAHTLASVYQIRQSGTDRIKQLGIEDAPDNLAALETWIWKQYTRPAKRFAPALSAHAL